jgi:rhamnosyltransferase
VNICILLATYNGSAFLEEQLESLIAQTEINWQCLIRDDGSKDNTVEIVKKYCLKDLRFTMVSDGVGPMGNAMENFSLLMAEGMKTKAKYFFFSDQDDVWMPNKIDVMYKQLKQYADDVPLLIHHDLEVVSDKLTLLNSSFIKYAGLDPLASFAQLLNKNVVTGCASACNRALFKTSMPIPSGAMMHDWWLALKSAYKGQLIFLDEKLVKYRQHNNNVLGAQSFWKKLKLSKLKSNWQRQILVLNSSINQSKDFLQLELKTNDVCDEKYIQLEAYSNIKLASKIRRISIARKMSFFPNNWFLKIIYSAKLLSL